MKKQEVLDTEKIKACIKEAADSCYLESLSMEECAKIVSDRVSSYLTGIKKEGKISGSSIVKIERRTWEKEYPNLFKRIIAKTTYYLVRKKILSEFHGYNLDTDGYKWYHFLLPFTVKIELLYPELDQLKSKWYLYTEVGRKSGEGLQEDIEKYWKETPPDVEWICKNYIPTICNNIIMKNPTDFVDVDFLIVPVRPVESISTSFVLK